MDLLKYLPLRATLFLLTLNRASSGIVVTPSFKKGVTSTSSQTIGTLFAAKIFLTAAEISGPIPSPGIIVTIWLPFESNTPPENLRLESLMEFLFKRRSIFLNFGVKIQMQQKRIASAINWTPKRFTRSIHSFDTFKFIQELEQANFKRQEAESIMDSLSNIIKESTTNITNQSVNLAEFDKLAALSRVEISSLRREVIQLEKNDFTALENDINRLENDLVKQLVRYNEELARLKSNTRHDVFQERNHSRDDIGHNEMEIKELFSKINTQVSVQKGQMETIQWELFRTLFPLFCAGGALFFSYLRLIK